MPHQEARCREVQESRLPPSTVARCHFDTLVLVRVSDKSKRGARVVVAQEVAYLGRMDLELVSENRDAGPHLVC